MKEKKKIYVLEMSCPWIESRNKKYQEKVNKYKSIITNLRIDNPGYEVKQLTFIMDCLGGSSRNLVEMIKELEFSNDETDSIIFGMQKIIMNEAQNITKTFKILAYSVNDA